MTPETRSEAPGITKLPDTRRRSDGGGWMSEKAGKWGELYRQHSGSGAEGEEPSARLDQ